jgi:hypothetical protein
MITVKSASESPMSRHQIASLRKIILELINESNINSLINFVGLTHNEARIILTKDKQIIFSSFKEMISVFLKDVSTIDKRIELPEKSIEIVIPDRYSQNIQLGSFGETIRKNKHTYYFNPNLKDVNFMKTSQKLKPGESYEVKFFKVIQNIPIIECLNFMKSQGALMTGAQGLTLLFEMYKYIIPSSGWVVSIDEKITLWKDDQGFAKVLAIGKRSDGDVTFELIDFDGNLSRGDCFMCFFASN